MLRAFGFNEVSAYLSTKPEKSVGDFSLDGCEKALEENLPYELDEALCGPEYEPENQRCLCRP